MRRLTAAERELVEQHVDYARRLACSFSYSLPVEDRISEAYLALCLAAMSPPDYMPFKSFVYLKIRTRIQNLALRQQTFWRHHQCDPAAGEHRDPDPGHRLDCQDLAARYRRRFDRLKPRERQALELYSSGLDWHEVADRMGVWQETVHSLKRRAAAKLLPAVAP